jgi:two-component system chemotaxis response regulator CheY
MKILIVDDELQNRKLMRDYLKPYGQCDMASDGRAALELFVSDLEDGDPYDLVILDIIMPVMDGQKTLTRIRSAEKRVDPNGKGATILMITGMDSSLQAMEAYFRGGCSDYLTKPITRQVLVEKLIKLKLIEEMDED